MDALYQNLSFLSIGMGIMFYITISIQLNKMGHKSRIQSLLLYQFIFWAFLSCKDIIYTMPSYFQNPDIITRCASFDTWISPLLFIFFLELILPNYFTRQRTLVLMSPHIIVTALILAYPHPYFYILLFSISAIVSIIGAIIIYIIAQRTEEKLNESYSNQDSISVEWVKKVMVSIVVFAIIWEVLNLHDSSIGHIIYHIWGIFTWGYIYSYTIKHELVPLYGENYSFKELRHKIFDNQEADSFVTLLPFKFSFAENIDSEMKKAQHYLNPTLTISEFASLIGTNRTYLSEYLNHHRNISYYDYINNYRVDHALELIENNNHSSLEEVAFYSGFNSMATFRRAFSKRTGMTPNKFKVSQEQLEISPSKD